MYIERKENERKNKGYYLRDNSLLFSIDLLNHFSLEAINEFIMLKNAKMKGGEKTMDKNLTVIRSELFALEDHFLAESKSAKKAANIRKQDLAVSRAYGCTGRSVNRLIGMVDTAKKTSEKSAK